MFGRDYHDLHRQAAKAKRIKVTCAEFIRLMVKSGATEDEAQAQAKICQILGSEVLLGGKLVCIEKEANEHQP